MKPTLFGRECLKPQVRAPNGDMQYQLTIERVGGGLDTSVHNHREIPLGTASAHPDIPEVRIYAGLRETAAYYAQGRISDAKLGRELARYIIQHIHPKAEQKYLSKQEFGPEDISPDEAAALRDLGDKLHKSVIAMIDGIDRLLLVPGVKGVPLQRVPDKNYLFDYAWKPVE